MTGLVLAAALLAAGPDVSALPDGVQLVERLGESVPLDVTLTDHRGRTRTVAALFGDERPVVLVLAYFRCPMLCGVTVDGLARGLLTLDLDPQSYRVITVSFDPRDRAADAERARARALDLSGRAEGEDAWPFLVGEPAEVRRLADSLGFGYIWDDGTQQYAHPAVVFVLTADGTISRYLHGFEHPVADLRMALVEAGRGEVGSYTERLLVSCYRYDPSTRRYRFAVFAVLRIAAFLVLAVFGLGLVGLWRVDRRRSREVR